MTNLRIAARVSAVYLVVGCAWILLSDWITFADADIHKAYWFQTAKGLSYVFATAILLFCLIRHDSRLLSESEARFRLLVERAPDAVLVQSEGRIVYMNAAALQLIGASPDDQMVGRDVLDIIHPDSRDLVKRRIASVTDAKLSLMCQEETYMRVDGSPVVCEVSAVPILFNRKDSALVFVRDATDRKFEQERQSNAQKMELVRRLAGGLAHELNNLVHVINGNVELAHETLPTGAPGQRYLDQVLCAGRQVSDCVGKIMAFSSSPNPSIESLELSTKSIKTQAFETHIPVSDSAPSLTVMACQPGAATVAESVPAAEDGAPDGGTILLAEDDGMVRALTERFLTNAGYLVLLARDGVEAVTVFEANACRISAVLLDVVMPRMDGFEAYQRISALDANMPVIFASGFSGYGTPANLELIAGVNFLQKPFDRSELVATVRRAVKTRQAALFS